MNDGISAERRNKLSFFPLEKTAQDRAAGVLGYRLKGQHLYGPCRAFYLQAGNAVFSVAHHTDIPGEVKIDGGYHQIAQAVIDLVTHTNHRPHKRFFLTCFPGTHAANHSGRKQSVHHDISHACHIWDNMCHQTSKPLLLKVHLQN